MHRNSLPAGALPRIHHLQGVTWHPRGTQRCTQAWATLQCSCRGKPPDTHVWLCFTRAICNIPRMLHACFHRLALTEDNDL